MNQNIQPTAHTMAESFTKSHPSSGPIKPPQADAPEVVPPPTTNRPKPPWDFWDTLLCSFLCVLFWILGIVFVFLAIALSCALRGINCNGAISLLFEHQLCHFFILLFGMLVGYVVLKGYLQHREPSSVREFLALNAVPWRRTLKWMAGFLLLEAALLCIQSFIPFPEMDDDFATLIDEYQQVSMPLTFWINCVLLGPLVEELFFRGFLYRGLSVSRLGKYGSLIIISFLFAWIHIQYAHTVRLTILLNALFVGFARIHTNSTYLPIGMHSLNNLFCLISVHYAAGQALQP